MFSCGFGLCVDEEESDDVRVTPEESDVRVSVRVEGLSEAGLLEEFCLVHA